MAAGKTSIGRHLARALQREFVDSDALVVAARGRTIEQIFAHEGEAAFRRYEFAALSEALARAAAVVATGGGAVTHAPTHALLARHCIVVYVHVAEDEIYARLRRSATPRPMIGEAPTRERIRELLRARESLYRQADVVVHGGKRASDVAAEIARILIARPTGER